MVDADRADVNVLELLVDDVPIFFFPVTIFAADLRPQDLSARPIDNVSISRRADRAFLTDVAADLLWQRKAVEVGLQFFQSSISIEEANFALKTLQEIQEDLEELAKARDVALPLEGSPLPMPTPVPVTVGGATVFVLPVEHFEEI